MKLRLAGPCGEYVQENSHELLTLFLVTAAREWGLSSTAVRKRICLRIWFNIGVGLFQTLEKTQHA